MFEEGLRVRAGGTLLDVSVGVRIRIGMLLVAPLLSACGGDGQTAAPSQPGPEGGSPVLSGELTVFAAASLTDAFEAIGERFEAANPDVGVSFNFGSSSTLATQIAEGAPADVFASANQTQMDVVTHAGLVAGERADFAGNSLEIAVEPGNPLGIGSLEDLARSDVTLVLAAEAVPAGQYAREALDAREIEVEPASLEIDVRAVLSRITLGEADAGIVYASDVVAAGEDVEGVEIPAEQNVRASYPIATLADAPNSTAGDAFVDYVLSSEGQEVLRAFGFTAP
jgi:molybdate transport system substrate-binding protein